MNDFHAISRTTRISPIAALERHERLDHGSVEQQVAAPSEAATFDGIPATVPDDVLAEIEEAMERLEDLRSEGTSVSFDVDGGLGITLTGPDGHGRAVGAGELFGIIDGAPTTGAPVRAAPAHCDLEV